jgi:hypothetical protein
MSGKILEDGGMPMIMSAGEVRDKKNVYLLGIGIGNSAPIIYNQRTEKYWSIEWDELLQMAKKAGIDDLWE